MVSNTFIGAADNMTTWILVALLVVLVIVLLVVPMFTNKKRAKQTQELHNSLHPGDVIKTVGGIIGTVKEVRQITPNDREMVIETGDGDNKTTMTFDINALYQVISRVGGSASAQSADVFAASTESETPVESTEKTIEEKVEVAEDKKEDVAAAEPVVEKSEPVDPTPVAEPEAAAPAQEEAATVDEAKPEEQPEPAAKPAAKKPAAKKPAAASPAKKKPVSNAKNSAKK